ncbi:hypothetical protein ALC56_04024 [Trachymyrmex septentrionalis]|uniref:Uncharacterized protein n=1 Tax=Trachymyrmex septentrionalis TaxID=34720 RepID=A0A151JYV1_9HYME|nr:hypothetical protein ALC56_04024 [Trachymyrmex septentrionalis]
MRTFHRSYFDFIRFHFGSHAVNCLKSWIKCRRLIVKNYVHARFIKQYILNDVTPRHLNIFDNCSISFYSSSSDKKLSNLKSLMIKRILRIELSDSYRAIDRYRAWLFHLVDCISVFLPTNIGDEFLRTQGKSCHRFFTKERERLDSKLRWLINKKFKRPIVGIVPIQYSLDSVRKPVNSTSGNFFGSLGRDSLVNPAPYVVDPSSFPTNSSPSPMISIFPNSFPPQVPSSLSTVRDGWFLNLSSCVIPHNVQCFLQLGNNFALPFKAIT